MSFKKRVKFWVIGITTFVVVIQCVAQNRSEADLPAREPDGDAPLAAPDEDASSAALVVSIEGVDGQLLENVEAYLRIGKLVDREETLPSSARIRWLHEQATLDIEQALAPFGYYRPQIEPQLLEQPDGGWQATYRIDPKDAVVLQQVDIHLTGAAQDDPAFSEYLSEQPLKVGDALHHQRYEEVKSKLVSLATERGYFDARFAENEIRVDVDAYHAQVKLIYDSGDRYRFGEVHFEQSVLADEFLQRYVTFEAGEPYYAPTLLAMQSDLIDSEYFSEVSVSAPISRADAQIVPVVVTAEPKKSKAYSVGIGFGTDTGIRGRGGIDQRRVNRWGHRYEIHALLSQIEYSLGASYTIPGENPKTDSLGMRAKLAYEDSDVTEATTASLGLTQQYQDGPWLKINSLDYQWEQFSFPDSEETTTSLLIGGINWSRIDADPDRINVTDGTRFGFELRGSVEPLLSDISFAQAVVGVKWIKSFSPDARVIARGDAGATYVADEDFDQLPSSLRFFAGGDSSVRGFSLDSIGPKSATGDVIGGKFLTVGSLEYEHRIMEKWSLATFVDVGDAFSRRFEPRTGVGLGVRWLSPVGPVRVDLASGLDDPGDAVRLHVSIGPDL